ncbi:hypothetical protein R0J90_13245, partial [Micrococcus sp. SIMBA_144]
NHPNSFYKQGFSSTGSQKYQCKSCKKKTSLTPKREESITYNQKRHDLKLTCQVCKKTLIARIGIPQFFFHSS